MPETEVQTPPADPSPALEADIQHVADQIPASRPIEKWSPEERKEWLRTGKPPNKAASATAQPAEGSEPPADGDPAAPPPAKPKTEARFQELLKERAQQRSEIDRLKAELAKATGGAAPPPANGNGNELPPQPKKLEAPKPPRLSDFETWEQYEEARDKHAEAVAEYKIQQDRAEQVKTAQQAELARLNKAIEDSWVKRRTAAEAAHADYATVTDKTPISPVMDAFILDSEHGAEILYALGSDKKNAQRIASIANPIQAAREMVALEGKVSGQGASAQPASGADRQERRVSAASPPAREIGGTQTVGDPVAAAVKDGDFARYKAEADRREIERRRGSR